MSYNTDASLARGFSHIFDRAAYQIRIRYFNQSYDDVYDDSVILTQSGTDLWTSGIILPINSRYGSEDSVLFEQGKISNADKKIYLHGSLLLTGSELQCKIQIGKPTGDNYSILPDGIIQYQIEDQPIYQKVYIRRLTGSLIGEE